MKFFINLLNRSTTSLKKYACQSLLLYSIRSSYFFKCVPFNAKLLFVPTETHRCSTLFVAHYLNISKSSNVIQVVFDTRALCFTYSVF